MASKQIGAKLQVLEVFIVLRPQLQRMFKGRVLSKSKKVKFDKNIAVQALNPQLSMNWTQNRSTTAPELCLLFDRPSMLSFPVNVELNKKTKLALYTGADYLWFYIKVDLDWSSYSWVLPTIHPKINLASRVRRKRRGQLRGRSFQGINVGLHNINKSLIWFENSNKQQPDINSQSNKTWFHVAKTSIN